VSLVSPLANAIAIPLVTLAVAPLAVAGIAWPGDACFVAAHALLAPLMRLMEALASLPPRHGRSTRRSRGRCPPPRPASPGCSRRAASRARARRVVAAAAVRRAAAAAARRRRADHGARRRAGARGRRAHASPRVVYDTGPRWHGSADAGGRIVAPFLRHEGIERVDRLVVSHQDLDHAGGAASLVQAVPVARIVSSLRDDHPLFDVRPACRRSDARPASAGRATASTSRCCIRRPRRTRTRARKTNDLSCVVAIDAGGTRVLLAGDIEARSEARLVRASRDALRGAGARRAAPRQPHVVDARVRRRRRSRDRDLHAGLPQPVRASAPDVVARYVARGARTLRTDSTAPIAFDIGTGGRRRRRAARVEFARYWRVVPRTSAARLDP
jgi:competence protein ComEC